MAFAPGVRFGRYVIEAALGTGGMGQVLRATDTLLERSVALKVIRPGLEDIEEVTARFHREARLAAQVKSPNTVEVYDVGVVNGTPFLAMELLDGTTLTRYIGDASVPVTQKVQWMLGVARGLAAAHERSLLHRDMKPGNVMITREGGAKIIDFGMAKSSSPNANVRTAFRTMLGHVVGTPAYMAPEQLESGETDARADQFAWALTTYELLSGMNPRMADPTLASAIPPLATVVPAVGARVSEIVTRALSRRRDARFASMNEIVAALAKALEQPLVPSSSPQIPDDDEPTDYTGPPVDDWIFAADPRARPSGAIFRSADAVVQTARAIGVTDLGALVFEESWEELSAPPFTVPFENVRAVRLLPRRRVALAGKDSLAVVIPATARPRDEEEARKLFGRAHMFAPPWQRWAPVAGARFDGVSARSETSFVFVGQRGGKGIAMFATDDRAVLRELGGPPLVAVDTDAQARSVACGARGYVVFLDSTSAAPVGVGHVDLFAIAVLEGRALVGGEGGYLAFVSPSGGVEVERIATTTLITAVAWDAVAGAWAATRDGAIFHKDKDSGEWRRVHDLGEAVVALRADGDDAVAVGASGTIARGQRTDLR